MNFVAASYDQSVPCVNCVTGFSVPTLGISARFNFINAGTTMQYLLSMSVNNVTGSCAVTVSAAAGSTALFAQTQQLTGLNGAGQLEVAFVQPPISYSGNAFLVGKVTCNGRQTRLTKEPLIFQ